MGVSDDVRAYQRHGLSGMYQPLRSDADKRFDALKDRVWFLVKMSFLISAAVVLVRVGYDLFTNPRVIRVSPGVQKAALLVVLVIDILAIGKLLSKYIAK